MVPVGEYLNLASSEHPATVIYLLDISGSTDRPMLGGRKRIDVLKDAIRFANSEMTRRSLRQGIFRPRYRLAIVAYSGEVYDVYKNLGSFIAVESQNEVGLPGLTPQDTTNMAAAFRYAADLLRQDIAQWPREWIDQCPAPVVVNLTDCEVQEAAEDPAPSARELMQISVPDGSVLVENIFITEHIRLLVSGVAQWSGYRLDEHTGSPSGDKLLAMSSSLPPSYHRRLLSQTGWNLREGSAMFFPGMNPDFIRAGFIMSALTGAGPLASPVAPAPAVPPDLIESYGGPIPNIPRPSPVVQPVPPPESPAPGGGTDMVGRRGEVELERRIYRDRSASIPRDTERRRAEGAASARHPKISVAHPARFSKRWPARFLVQIHAPELRGAARKQIIANIGSTAVEHVYDGKFRLGVIVKVKLSSPEMDFPAPVILRLDSPLISTPIVAKILDTCHPGPQPVTLSILEDGSDVQLQAELFTVQVDDFAFDHVQRPALSIASAIVLGIGSLAMYILTLLAQIDKTAGLASGTAAAVAAAGLYGIFHGVYQRLTPRHAWEDRTQ